MEWQPWYRFVISALILAIIKVLTQRKTKKKYKINRDEIKKGKENNLVVDEKLENVNQSPLEGSAANLTLKLIEEMGYILILNKNLHNTSYYEITFKNYEKKLFDFKRESTFIKVTGHDKSKEISYTTWSERYEYGQNSHNDKIAQDFLEKLKEKMS